jgi:hypothetical protein
MESGEWEQFVLEWQDSLAGVYSKVEKLGGPGDQGRDVVCYVNHKNPTAPWDSHQCKFYDHALRPGDIWLELGKLCYYTCIGAYTVPRSYFFCAPRGVGTTLSNLLKRPEDIRANLITNWKAHCRDEIKSTPTPLSGRLLSHVRSFDFAILDHRTPMELIAGHRSTVHFIPRFGGGLPERLPPLQVPSIPGQIEIVYVRQLLDAYAEHVKAKVDGPSDIPATLTGHFDRSRRDFFHAESLREFSRDNLPAGEFESLQNLIHSHVADVVESQHADGYRRVVATTREARLLPIDSHALKDCINSNDKTGICHQLANNGLIKWVKT